MAGRGEPAHRPGQRLQLRSRSRLLLVCSQLIPAPWMARSDLARSTDVGYLTYRSDMFKIARVRVQFVQFTVPYELAVLFKIIQHLLSIKY